MVIRGSTMLTVRRFNCFSHFTIVLSPSYYHPVLSPSYYHNRNVTFLLFRFTIIPSYCQHRTAKLHNRTDALNVAFHHYTVKIRPNVVSYCLFSIFSINLLEGKGGSDWSIHMRRMVMWLNT